MIASSTLSQLFIFGNLLVTPLYVLMVFLPRWTLTERVVRSPWSVSPPAFLTVIFGISFVLTDAGALPMFIELMSGAASMSAFDIYHTSLIDLPPSALVMWLHAVAADVVMARWAYLDSREHRFPVIPVSIAIMFMATNGPLGFVIYLPLRSFYLNHSQRQDNTPALAAT